MVKIKLKQDLEQTDPTSSTVYKLRDFRQETVLNFSFFLHKMSTFISTLEGDEKDQRSKCLSLIYAPEGHIKLLIVFLKVIFHFLA